MRWLRSQAALLHVRGHAVAGGQQRRSGNRGRREVDSFLVEDLVDAVFKVKIVSGHAALLKRRERKCSQSPRRDRKGTIPPIYPFGRARPHLDQAAGVQHRSR